MTPRDRILNVIKGKPVEKAARKAFEGEKKNDFFDYGATAGCSDPKKVRNYHKLIDVLEECSV